MTDERGVTAGAGCATSDEAAARAADRTLWLLLLPALAWVWALVHDPLAGIHDRDGAAFDAGAARADLERIAAGERSPGSPGHAAALDHLESRLTARGHAVERAPFRHLSRAMQNVICVSEGTHSTGTVVLMAHHDSVVGCPGASDDGVGTVCALEIFLHLADAGHRNDLLLLLTDGEELSMLGADWFVKNDPRMADVRAVVNLESLGNAGAAWLFETGPEDGRWIAEFARRAPRAYGTSVAEVAYRTLMRHRNTDFTRFRDRGVGGFNFANLWGTAANHRPFDTFENLDLGTLAHLGDSGLAATRVVVEADLAAEPTPGPVFFMVPLLGMVVIHPLASTIVTWLAVVTTLWVLVGALRRERGTRRVIGGALAGLLAFALALALALFHVFATHFVVGVVSIVHEPVGNAISMRWFAGGVALVAAGGFAWTYGALRARLHFESVSLLLPWAALALALEWSYPAAAHALALPLLATALALAAPASLRVPGALAAAVVSVVLTAPLLQSFPQGMSNLLYATWDPGIVPTIATAVPAAGLAALAGATFAPAFAHSPRTGRRVAHVGAALLFVWAFGSLRGW